MIKCGHTSCYNCLCECLPDNSSCPHCREAQHRQPILKYRLREVLHGVTRRDIDDMTAEEHMETAEEVAARIAKDRVTYHPNTGGLSKRTSSKDAVRWPEEQFDRCRMCHGRAERGYCSRCRLGVRSWDAARACDQTTVIVVVDDEDERVDELIEMRGDDEGIKMREDDELIETGEDDGVIEIGDDSMG